MVPPIERLVVAGELDASNAADLREALSSSTSPVVIDMAAVTFIDSTILGALARATRMRHITVVSPARQVRRVLRISGLDQIVTVE